MMFDIKVKIDWKDGRLNEHTDYATEVHFATKNGNNAIKYLKEGKNRFTWLEIPNEWQLNKFYNAFEVNVIESTTGKKTYSFNR